MSLLNQVLQDLDERAPAGESQPVRLSVAPAASSFAADHGDDGSNWLRLGAGLAVIVIFVAAVWIFHGTDGDRSEQNTSVQASVSPVDGAVDSATLSEQRATNTPEQPPIAHSLHESEAQAAAVVVLPTAQGKTANPKVPPVRQSLPLVTEVSSEVPTAPLSDSRQEKNEGRVVPTEVAYLPLRNTGLPIVDEVTPEVAATTTRADVSVKTPKAPLPDVVEGARVAIDQGELSEAESVLQRRLQRVPGDQDARELLVGLMLRGERHDAAMQQLDQGLEQHPGDVKFSLIKARLLAQIGEPAAATRILEESTPSATGRVQRLQMLGALYQQQSRYDQAADSYRELLQLNPSAGASWVGLAISLDGLGDSAALAAYERALTLGGLPAAADTYARQRVSQLELSVD